MELQRDPKRIRISIEPHHEKKIYSTTADGTETCILEPTPEERVSRLIFELNQEKILRLEQEPPKYSDSLLLDLGEQEAPNKNIIKNERRETLEQSQTIRHPWKEILDQLFHARMELENIIGLTSLMLNNLQSQSQLSLWYIRKPIISLAVQHNELALSSCSKCQALLGASSVLSKGIGSLRLLIERERKYFDDLLRL